MEVGNIIAIIALVLFSNIISYVMGRISEAKVSREMQNDIIDFYENTIRKLSKGQSHEDTK